MLQAAGAGRKGKRFERRRDRDFLLMDRDLFDDQPAGFEDPADSLAYSRDGAQLVPWLTRQPATRRPGRRARGLGRS